VNHQEKPKIENRESRIAKGPLLDLLSSILLGDENLSFQNGHEVIVL